MWMIVGLGNPGEQYEWTRHNAGFLVVDELARRVGQTLRVKECQALTARVTLAGQAALLVKPQTFMNLSGVAVAQLQSKHDQRDTARVLAITDDFALPFGKLRIRPDGSAGGHNGLKSLIAKLQTPAFPRLRLGIAPDHLLPNHLLPDHLLKDTALKDAADFVLTDFPRKDRAELTALIERAADAVEAIITDGVVNAMNKFN